MNATIRNIQLVAVLIVLAATVIAFFLEIHEMYLSRDINLADLLLMFIYIEVIGLVRSYWGNQISENILSNDYSYYCFSQVHYSSRQRSRSN